MTSTLVKLIFLAAAALLILSATPGTRARAGEPAKPTSPPGSLYELTVKDTGGKDVKLSRYKGDVLLIVNVASR